MISGRIFLSPPHMSGRETEYVKQAFESNYIAHVGPQLNRFHQPSKVNVNLYFRKRVAGGQKNHFNHEARIGFYRLARKQLIKSRYEPNYNRVVTNTTSVKRFVIDAATEPKA